MSIETLEQKPNHYEPFNTRERLYYDTATWAAEVLDGSMCTTFEYSFDGQDLYASDGSSMRTVFEDAVEDADKLAQENPNLSFEKRRRLTELDEYEEMAKMAAGEGPNTMVVVSEYPGELDGSDQDIGGYNHQRKQTMLRVICRTEEGKIRVTSQSLDKSDRQGLESIYGFFGQKPEPGELLGQRIRAEVEPCRQELLADELTREYDRSLEDKFGREYYAGRTPAERENTYDFVIKQQDLLGAFMQNATDDNKYAYAAALDKRWSDYKEPSALPRIIPVDDYSRLSFAQVEMTEQALLAKQENKVYSGCGVTLDSGNLEMELDSLGYGNKNSDEQLSWHGGKVKKGKCVNCNDGPKDVGVEDWCKACISGHCGSK